MERGTIDALVMLVVLGAVLAFAVRPYATTGEGAQIRPCCCCSLDPNTPLLLLLIGWSISLSSDERIQ